MQQQQQPQEGSAAAGTKGEAEGAEAMAARACSACARALEEEMHLRVGGALAARFALEAAEEDASAAEACRQLKLARMPASEFGVLDALCPHAEQAEGRGEGGAQKGAEGEGGKGEGKRDQGPGGRGEGEGEGGEEELGGYVTAVCLLRRLADPLRPTAKLALATGALRALAALSTKPLASDELLPMAAFALSRARPALLVSTLVLLETVGLPETRNHTHNNKTDSNTPISE
ncbi:hypothetical protein T492DRAFT_838646 [Pavlovales sp. CCMP2436]|nr:hypothetical protein T492DRAFT_838646 [Pavlovales sp. CCMP2436]